MGDRWHVVVDHAACVGSGMCRVAAPAAFTLDSGRRSHPVAPDADASEPVLAAAEGCPVEAITITLGGTDEPVFPPQE